MLCFNGEIVPQYEFSVSLKVTHPEMKASDISEKLSMQPEMCSDVGADRKSRNGRLLGGVYDCTIWSKSLSSGKIDAEEMLFEDFVSNENSSLSMHQTFFKEVREAGGSIEYFVGWFSAGSINMNLVLEPELMQETSALGLSIVLCAYPDNE
jgi:hypothetical protein